MSSRGLPTRRSSAHVRRQPTRHEAPSLGSVQILAAGIMAACLAAVFAVSGSPSFAARTLEIHGATFTSQAVIRSIVGIDGQPNVFGLETDRAAEQLARLPAVRLARVRVRLPSTIVVELVERVPRIVWVIGDNRFVADEDGFLFGRVDSAGNPIPSEAGPLASATAAPATPTPTSAAPSSSGETSSSPSASISPARSTTASSSLEPSASPSESEPSAASSSPTYNPSLAPSLAPAPTADPAAVSGPNAVALPVVFDRRASDAALGLGGIVDPVNLDAGYRLAGLTPADLESKASALAVVTDDVHGFTVSSVPVGWVAEFGFYAATIRKTSVIPEQVRALRSLLARYGEDHVAWVWLVGDVGGNNINTFLPR